jgi:hypothetical protein
MAIIRNPNQSYERKFGQLKMYLDDLEDVYRYLHQTCTAVKLEVGDNGQAESIDDLKDADIGELRELRLTAHKRAPGLRRLRPANSNPDIVVSLGAEECRALATQGDNESKAIIDSLARLLENHKRRSGYHMVFVAYAAAMISALLGLRFDDLIWLFSSIAVVGMIVAVVMLTRVGSRPAIVAQRRREARGLSVERRGQIALAVISGVLGLAGGLVIAWISNFLPEAK